MECGTWKDVTNWGKHAFMTGPGVGEFWTIGITIDLLVAFEVLNFVIFCSGKWG